MNDDEQNEMEALEDEIVRLNKELAVHGVAELSNN